MIIRAFSSTPTLLWQIFVGTLLLLQSHFVTQFSMEKLESLIGSMPEDLHSSIVIPWLQDDLVPFISRAFPSGLVS